MDSGKKTSIVDIKSFYSKWRGTDSGSAGTFTIIIIGVFPLASKDCYFDILNFKTFFYHKVVIIFAVTFLTANVIFLILLIYLGYDRSMGRKRKICTSNQLMLDFILIVGASTP